MVYFDFNDFKPFNDYYGFRKGDRVILLFADILKKNSKLKDCLVGHIGGDDFFLGWHNKEESYIEIFNKIKKIVDKFSNDVESFYDEKDRNNGYIHAKGRDGKMQNYNILTVSAAIVLIKASVNSKDDIFAQELSKLKKSAK